MDLRSSLASSSTSLSGSTAVNASDLDNYGGNNLSPDLFPRDSQFQEPPEIIDDLMLFGNDSDAEDRRISADIFGMYDDEIPDLPNLLEDEAFDQELPEYDAVRPRLSIWLANLLYMGNATLATISRWVRSESSSHGTVAERPLLNIETTPHAAFSESDEDAPQSASSAKGSLGVALLSSLLINFDVIIRLIRHGVTRLKFVLLGRLLVGMLVFCTIYGLRTRSRRGGRGQGEILMMMQFWAAFLLAKILPRLLEKLDLLFEPNLPSSRRL